ncbi:glycosyltransferase family 2 protein [Parasphingorhabdus halotolerans]|uniref:glycosyltransferase family 2 protein n=1 Tax=Parasphingorhabdus halotolerans TaxID=2725558 RepID=UPI001FE288D3|nr:glycosyltransferase family 2 protein [Parasphingorhabdus halotolerans]
MYIQNRQEFDQAQPDENAGFDGNVDVTIVMPCLNEIISLPHCIANAQDTLAMIMSEYQLTGEIVIADNGSDDGSQDFATSMGARVVDVTAKGYGAALIGGCRAAAGRYILMGDADGSYNFTEGVAMIGKLVDGADLCMGSRFQGGIAPGAMPWKNRYIGNPALTGILNLFFRSDIDDAHCGLRAITKDSFDNLGLSGTGMEFASEMVIKAHLKKLHIEQVPATLSRDLRDRAPHLRPWRDGWRHLRYLLMLSPTWVFGVPAAAAIGISTLLLMVITLHSLGVIGGKEILGTGWTIAAGFLFTAGHLAAIMAVTSHLHGVNQGYRHLRPIFRKYENILTLETMLICGFALILSSVAGFVGIAQSWSIGGFAPMASNLPLVLAATAGTTGLQTILGGFLFAIISGHRADFGDFPSSDSLRRMAN